MNKSHNRVWPKMHWQFLQATTVETRRTLKLDSWLDAIGYTDIVKILSDFDRMYLMGGEL